MEQGSDPAAEVERLRALLDLVPSCLLRVAADGTLLAVNNTARDLLGGLELAQLLGTNVVDRLRADGPALWGEFVTRVRDGGSGSTECEMDGPGGVRRTVTLLGAALPRHPDGVASLLVAVRDISAARRLEASLHEQEGVQRALRAALDDALRTVQELREHLDRATEAATHAQTALERTAGE